MQRLYVCSSSYCTDTIDHILILQASAYIRRQVPSVQNVYHLQGGIHKYLEEFGNDNDGVWQGRNYVFDSRQAVSADETRRGRDPSMNNGDASSDHINGDTTKDINAQSTSTTVSDIIVGQCVSCQSPYDTFHPQCVCVVCREPVLVCPSCQAQVNEYHCKGHYHLKSCYFCNLDGFTDAQLQDQLVELQSHLEPIAIGRKYKKKRNTLLKQIERIAERLGQGQNGYAKTKVVDATADKTNRAQSTTACRNCGDAECTGRCWGFFGLKRKERLEQEQHSYDNGTQQVESDVSHRSIATSLLLAQSKKAATTHKKVQEGLGLEELGLFHPCITFRDVNTGIRVPPCVTRTLQCHAKARWCGRSVLEMFREEFRELSDMQVVKEVMQYGLIHLNGKPISFDRAIDTKLKNGDIVSRIVHWHDAPVLVPERLQVTTVALPDAVMKEYGLTNDTDSTDSNLVHVCDKPASVPVHKAGPYFANTLNVMAEAQLGLPCGSLTPMHRTDRVTSGLTLCCTNKSKLASIFQKSLTERMVDKMYIACVSGRCPSSPQDVSDLSLGGGLGKVIWLDDKECFQLDAPVETVDPANGIRAITSAGKLSTSLFRGLSYDEASDRSIVLCNGPFHCWRHSVWR
jgi:23S rRNA-/tRNA-specific pseudouridylate synthase/ribosomal protein L44E